VLAAALLAAPSGALAATQVGQTVDPSSSECSQDLTRIQLTSPGGQYSVPFDGVITSWSFLGGSTVPSQMKLKVADVLPGSFFSIAAIVGESALETPAANTLNTFSTRIPVRPNRSTQYSFTTIGFYFPSPNSVRCAETSATGYSDTFTTGDMMPGAGFGPTAEPGVQLDVSALLEQDADHDGFGDETQDQCPTTASTQGPCPTTPTTATTGQRAAAIKKCKRKFPKGKRRASCIKRAKKLPV
jgi:hypothetical protein